VSWLFGIDPGATGGLVLLRPDGSLHGAWRTPYDEAGYRLDELHELLRLAPRGSSCALERVRAVAVHGRQQGAQSMFTFGVGYGIWLSAIAAAGHRRVDVEPRSWAKLLEGLPRAQRPASASDEQWEKQRSNAERKQRKLNAVARARALCPDLPIRVQADWALADAFLIAWHVRGALSDLSTSVPSEQVACPPSPNRRPSQSPPARKVACRSALPSHASPELPPASGRRSEMAPATSASEPTSTRASATERRSAGSGSPMAQCAEMPLGCSPTATPAGSAGKCA